MTDRVQTFRHLHESGCFVIPNPWDVGSARALAHLGFKALATTSAGLAWSLGKPDHVSLEEALAHLRVMAPSVDVPMNADFEGGFATEPAGVAANVARAAATGIAGLSIEDSTRDASKPLVDFSLAVERMRAARKALDDGGTGVLLTARSEGFVAGPDLPVNVLAVGNFTVTQLAGLGVRRISVGGALARAAWAGFFAAAHEITADGTFSSLARATPSAELNRLFDNPANIEA
jgi:2-methylisocitrate lyase-like PEP mutase family enzyme